MVDFPLSDFTLYLTEDCNLRCSYCFQKRQDRVLALSTIEEALDLFQNSFTNECFINFYGGEPFLAFDTIRATIAFIEHNEILRGKNFRYSISTNGSLLTADILHFLNDHRFRVNLSHDGTAQEITRPGRMNPFILENMDRLIRLPDIEFTTNSVYVPATVTELFRSARFLIERGVENCQLTYSCKDSWDSGALSRLHQELCGLREYLLDYFHSHHIIPVENFRNRPKQGLFACAGGQERLTLAADGRLWGCRFFADLFTTLEDLPELKDYCFGDFRHFHSRIDEVCDLKTRSYGKLCMINYSTEQRDCRTCPHVHFCEVCPATAAFSTGAVGKLPAWLCEMKKIWHEEIIRFWEAAEKN